MFSRFEFKRVLDGGLAILAKMDFIPLPNAIKIAGMAEAYDVALAPHCPLGPNRPPPSPAYRFCFMQRYSVSRAWAFNYNKGRGTARLCENKEDFSMDGGFFKPLNQTGSWRRH